ncbi:MAG TPA: SgcJ/EcaC family oxidoreductase [Micromonosporaceae bacterium]|jgi:uncharacterized protein (TIGR02246 family)
MEPDPRSSLTALYEAVLDAWNAADADAFAAGFADDGVIVGFDGSQHAGRAEIAKQIGLIFADHRTGRYVGKVRDVRPVGEKGAILRAVAGVVPAGQTDLNPQLNSVQSITAEVRDGRWHIVHYQNTPAALHGRPDLADALTNELRALRSI